MSDVAETRGTGSFFGHPRGLANLFGIEVWERFSFYGMQAILIFYLYFGVADGGLGLPEDTATSIVGAYGGLVYLSTVLGAWIADRAMGPERTLFYSAVLVMAGHIGLAVRTSVRPAGRCRTRSPAMSCRGSPWRRRCSSSCSWWRR